MSLGEMLADSTVTGTPPFFLPPTTVAGSAAAAAATRALIMNPAAAAYLAAGAGAAPFLYGNNALRYRIRKKAQKSCQSVACLMSKSWNDYVIIKENHRGETNFGHSLAAQKLVSIAQKKAS